MPISEERRTRLERELPSAEATKTRVREYLAKADISQPIFARLIGYSPSAITAFLAGRYNKDRGSSTDVLVREAAEKYMSLHPLTASEVTSKLYETENVEQMRHWFHFCHKHRALAFVYGPPGSQKTFVFEHLIAEFNLGQKDRESSRNRAYYVRASVDNRPRDLIAKFCLAAGAPTGPSLQHCMKFLRFHLRETRTVFVLDEAQLCGIQALEALRELHDVEPRIGCLLAGSHGLKQFFDARAAELEQWNSRLEAGVELKGVSEKSARAILAIELPELDPEQINQMLEGSRVKDMYSRDANRTYLNMRRLFKNIDAIKRLSDEAEGAAE